jgi:hypothetical protein
MILRLELWVLVVVMTSSRSSSRLEGQLHVLLLVSDVTELRKSPTGRIPFGAAVTSYPMSVETHYRVTKSRTPKSDSDRSAWAIKYSNSFSRIGIPRETSNPNGN